MPFFLGIDLYGHIIQRFTRTNTYQSMMSVMTQYDLIYVQPRQVNDVQMTTCELWILCALHVVNVRRDPSARFFL